MHLPLALQSCQVPLWARKLKSEGLGDQLVRLKADIYIYIYINLILILVDVACLCHIANVCRDRSCMMRVQAGGEFAKLFWEQARGTGCAAVL